MPAFCAGPGPAFGWLITRTPEKPRATSTVASREPSSTTITSKAGSVWHMTLSSVSANVRAALKAGITTEQRAVMG